MSRILESCSECLGLRMSVSAIIYISTIVLPLLLSGCAGKAYRVNNTYVNNSGHDINVTAYGKSEVWVNRLTFSLPNGESKSLVGEFFPGNYFKDVLFKVVDSVTVDYGQGIFVTFNREDFSDNTKRSIYWVGYYDKKVISNDKKKYDVVLTFTFTDQDYLDAM